MSNSTLVSYTQISPNSTNPRNHAIDTITIHHLAGDMPIEDIGAFFADPERQASANYAVGTDGRIGQYVDEGNRSWCSGNRENDHRAITIEVCNDGGEPDWHVSDKALEATINLCVDICKRNGIARLNFTGEKDGSNLTMHKWFQATGCPGPYLGSKFPYIAEEVNRRLNPPVKTIYRVQTGAFSVKEYADAYLGAVRDAFPDAYMVMAGGMYKIQVGAFEVFAYAEDYLEKVRNAGFAAFLTTEQGESVPEGTGYTLTEFVTDIQKACGAPVDGIPGPETLSKTVTLSAKINATHAAVKPVQRRLLELGYVEVGTVDGEAGTKFTSAVDHFQQDNDGCEVDGEITAGCLTWQKLLGMA